MMTQIHSHAQIQNLIRQLNQVMTLKEIAKEVNALADLSIDDTRLSKIMRGQLTLTRYKKTAEFIDALNRLLKTKIGGKYAFAPDIRQIAGNYVGFYFDIDEHIFKPLLLILDSVAVELITTRYYYNGNFQLACNSAIIHLNVEKGNIPVIFYINLGDILSSKPTFHANVLIFHYIYPSGQGMVAGDAVFFYEPDALQYYQKVGDVFFSKYSRLPLLQEKAAKYFKNPQLLVTKDAVFDWAEYDKIFS